MTIGISLDDVLRDFLGKFKDIYQKEFEKDPIEPFNTFDLIAHFPFNSEFELNKFLYEDFSLELFGYVPEKYRNVILDLNKIYDQFKDQHNIIIISKEFGNSIPATLFFLSKTSCKIRDYKFVTSDKFVWDYCDVMITANPEIIFTVPENKNVIKVKTYYNINLQSTYEIDKLKNIIDEDIISKISNTKIISYTKID